MQIYAIFNSNKEYWHSGLRCFKKEPYFLKSWAETLCEHNLAMHNDDTADILSFEGTESEAIEFINKLEFTKERLKAIHDMNRILSKR